MFLNVKTLNFEVNAFAKVVFPLTTCRVYASKTGQQGHLFFLTGRMFQSSHFLELLTLKRVGWKTTLATLIMNGLALLYHFASCAVLTVLSQVHLNSLTCWLKRDWPAWRTETSGALNEFAQSDSFFFSLLLPPEIIMASMLMSTIWRLRCNRV